MKQASLTSEQLILRPFRHTDAAAIFAYASHPNVNRFLPWHPHATVRDSQRFIDAQKKESNSLLWGIYHVQDKTIIGECGFSHITEQHAELYYTLAPAYWGQGLATQAAHLLLEYAFETLKVPEVHVWTCTENKKSINVATRIGMQHMMHIPDFWYLHNKLQSVEVYTCIR